MRCVTLLRTASRLLRATGSDVCSCASISHAAETIKSTAAVSPHELVRDDLQQVAREMKQEVCSSQPALQTMAQYYLDASGKLYRPMLGQLMAHALNHHVQLPPDQLQEVMYKQRRVSMISEMFHAASLIHDDVIDQADVRRGKPSINVAYDETDCALVGDFLLANATIALAKLRNPDVVIVLSTILSDLVRGEFMQLGSAESESQRFTNYLQKTYLKTASLFANTCKAVAVLSSDDPELHEQAFLFGKHLGIAFQLIDDVLDVVSCSDVLGKPAAADLELGLATGPVLFAAQQYPELNALIMRRFSHPGDVTHALHVLNKTDGLEKTRLLAAKHATEAAKISDSFRKSRFSEALTSCTKRVLDRTK